LPLKNVFTVWEYHYHTGQSNRVAVEDKIFNRSFLFEKIKNIYNVLYFVRDSSRGAQNDKNKKYAIQNTKQSPILLLSRQFFPSPQIQMLVCVRRRRICERFRKRRCLCILLSEDFLLLCSHLFEKE